MNTPTLRTRLRELLTERFVPIVLDAGFVGPRKISGNKLSHDYQRAAGGEVHHLGIMFEKHQRPRFVVDLAIEPAQGYDALIRTGGRAVAGRVQPRPGPHSRSWFRADPPWWKRLLLPGRETFEHQAVEQCVRLWPEMEAWWNERVPSAHITDSSVLFPGNENWTGGG